MVLKDFSLFLTLISLFTMLFKELIRATLGNNKSLKSKTVFKKLIKYRKICTILPEKYFYRTHINL